MTYNPSRRKNPKTRAINPHHPKCFSNFMGLKCLDSLGIKGNWSSTTIWIQCPYAEECATKKGLSKGTINYFKLKAKEEVKLSFKIKSKIGNSLAEVLGID